MSLLSRTCYHLIFLITATTIWSQPTDRMLLAHYPLMGDLEDVTGNNRQLTVSNILILDSAVYSDGANSFSDTANRIRGSFPDLDHDDIYLSLEFQLDSIPGQDLSRTILVGGSGWRWLAASYNQTTKQISFRYNNWSTAPGSFSYEYDQWYHLELTYQRSTRTGKMFIDEDLVSSDTFELNDGNDRSVVLDCFCGHHAMGGYWRNLKIFGPDTTIIEEDTIVIEPKTDSLSLSCSVSQQVSALNKEDGMIRIVVKGGSTPYNISTVIEGEPWVHESDTSVTDIEFLPTGTYVINVADSVGSRLSCEISLRPPPTDLPLISHYPLIENAEDLLGTHDNLQLTNVPFADDMGIFSADHSNTDTFSQIFTILREIDLDDFYISLEVKLDSIENSFGRDKRSIFVLGQGWRQLAPVFHQSQKAMGLNYNNWEEANGTTTVQYDQWYEVSAAYRRENSRALMYLDRQLIVDQELVLETNNDRSFVLWCNCGPQPIQGFWRNLRIYSPIDSNITSSTEVDDVARINIFPNPGTDQITLKIGGQMTPTPLRIMDSRGQLYLTWVPDLKEEEILLDIQSYPSGIYYVQLGPITQSFIKM